MKPVRSGICWLAAAAAALTLAACGLNGSGGQAKEPPYTPLEMAQVILATQPGLPALQALAPGNDFSAYLRDVYAIDPARVEDGVVCCPVGFEANEVAVLRFTSPQEAESAEEALRAYIGGRTDDFEGYAPEQAALAEQGAAVAYGRYAALLICEEGGPAHTAFQACFSENPPQLPSPPPALQSVPSVPSENNPPRSGPAKQPASEIKPPEAGQTPETKPPAPAGYDPKGILTAWQSGNDSALSEKNRAVLNMCREIIDQEINENMTDFEKELAIHDWIVRWAEYDWAVDSPNPAAKIEPDHDNPYGLLIGKRAICSGYSSTFQLFMDLLGIECITVPGAAFEQREEHAWNQVRLGGEWYCVDVTWDDPYGGDSMEVDHSYFNVTSRVMRNSGHHWDEAAVPECEATLYGGATLS